MWNLQDIKNYITAQSPNYGVPVSTSLGIFQGEGSVTGETVPFSHFDVNGPSAGPFQLHNAPGGQALGDQFTAQTGLAITPETIPQQIDFSLANMGSSGVGPWTDPFTKGNVSNLNAGMENFGANPGTAQNPLPGLTAADYSSGDVAAGIGSINPPDPSNQFASGTGALYPSATGNSPSASDIGTGSISGTFAGSPIGSDANIPGVSNSSAVLGPGAAGFNPDWNAGQPYDSQFTVGLTPGATISSAGAAESGITDPNITGQGQDLAGSPVSSRAVTAAGQTVGQDIGKAIADTGKASIQAGGQENAGWLQWATDIAGRIMILVLGFIFVVAGLALFRGKSPVAAVKAIA